MAKLQGPLFSASASGRVGNALCYRAGRAGAQALRPPLPSGPPSTPQASERARMRAAADAWASLDTTTRAQWTLYAAAILRDPWPVFFREYIIQQCHDAVIPLIPAAPFEP